MRRPRPITHAAADPVRDARRDIRQLRAGMREANIPVKLLDAVNTRACGSARRQTGRNTSNRDRRWNLDPTDPQYGTELDCQLIYARLLAEILTFTGAPRVDDQTSTLAERYLRRPIEAGKYRDPLTLEQIPYGRVRAEAVTPQVGIASIHIGHSDPTKRPRHTPGNVMWRTARSNLIQGNQTLRQARAELLRLIARYLDLGEITIRSGRR